MGRECGRRRSKARSEEGNAGRASDPRSPSEGNEAAAARRDQRIPARLAHLRDHHDKHAGGEHSRNAERRLIGKRHVHRT